MKALVIAAGKGTRLKSLTKDKPKPLVQLLGLSLIERVILSARQAGIDEFIIVIGYLGESIRDKLGNGDKYGLRITYVENSEWERGNAVSVLKARELLNGTFLLLMADHIFDSNILTDLKELKPKKDECVLVVDKQPKAYIDLDDASKVKLVNDKIVAIDKKLADYNCVDCGIFLLTSSIFDALDLSIKGGDETLSGGIRILANKGKMRSFDIKDNVWIDIDTEDSYMEAEKLLLGRLKKPTDGPIAKIVNRPASVRISKLLVKTKIAPNSISVFGFMLGVLSGVLFSMGAYFYVVLGGVMCQLASVVDGCDGEIARLKFQESDYGAWFDAVLDRYADALIILGMVYGWWKIYGSVGIWIVGFIAVIGSLINSYTAVKYDAIFARSEKKGGLRFGRDIRLLLIVLGAIFNQIFYTLVILGILTNAESMRRLYVLRNK